MKNIFGNIAATMNHQGSNMTPGTTESRQGYSVNPLDDMDAMGITGEEVFDVPANEFLNDEKENETMENNTLEQVMNNSAVEEVKRMENNITIVALDAVQVLAQLDIEKTSDKDYLTKDMLAGFLNANFGASYTKTSMKKVRRETMVEELRAALVEYLNDEDANDGTETVEQEVPGAADGFCEEEQADAIPGVEDMVAKYTSKEEVHNLIFGVNRGGRFINGIGFYARKYGKGVYVSEHIMTSVIAEQITGKALKNPKTGTASTYTQFEIDVIKGIRAFLVKNITRFTTNKDGAVTGYFLNAYTTAKINNGSGLKYWFRYTPESALKMGKKGETYIVRNNKLYMGKRCVVENMTYADYCKLDSTCSFWEFC